MPTSAARRHTRTHSRKHPDLYAKSEIRVLPPQLPFSSRPRYTAMLAEHAASHTRSICVLNVAHSLTLVSSQHTARCTNIESFKMRHSLLNNVQHMCSCVT